MQLLNTNYEIRGHIMNYGLILAGGVGQRMRTSGMPKQFLKVFDKPIIIYTLEKFEKCKDIDKIIIACNASWIDYMNDLLEQYKLTKVVEVVTGGKDRQSSIKNGINSIKMHNGNADDIVVIHDGVRPLVKETIISENIRIANEYGAAMTVKPVIESVCITTNDEVSFDDFKKRDNTYRLTAPQTFKLCKLQEIYQERSDKKSPIPILDAAIGYTYLGNKIHIVKENNNNLKVTTPEDYYILKAMLELEENKFVFGL